MHGRRFLTKEDAIWQLGSYPEPCRKGEETSFYTTLTKFSEGGWLVTIDRGVVFKLAQAAPGPPLSHLVA